MYTYYELANPKKTFIEYADIAVSEKGQATLNVKFKPPLKPHMECFRSIHGAKIHFGKQFQKGAKWQKCT